MSSNHRTTLTKSELKSGNTNHNSTTNPKSYYLNNNNNNQQKQQKCTKSSLDTEQTFYAKLVNVNNQSKMERVPVSTTINRNSLQRRNCMRNTAYVTNGSAARAAMATSAPRVTGASTRDSYLNAKLAEYLNEAEYETLVNFDSVLNTVAIPKVESPSSSPYSTLISSKSNNDYSNEDEDFQKYYKLEKFHSSLKKNIQKANTPPPEMLLASGAKLAKSGQFSIVGAKRHGTNSVGSFSSSSASSISSQSSAANSSTASSSSSSPLLSANFLTENAAAIYSSNFKIRNHKAEPNTAASPLPALPLTQPPSLTPLKQQDLTAPNAYNSDSKLIKSQSAIITKTMGSAWLHPSPALSSPTPSSVSRAPIADMDDSCAYSELTDSNSTLPSACVNEPTSSSATLKRSANSNNLKQYDSSLLTPLKPKTRQLNPNLTSPVRSNSSTNIKSASTSYLLSKLTSLTNNASSANAANTTSHSTGSPQQQSASTTNPLTNLANKTSKFFQSRKSLNQLNQYQDTPVVDTQQPELPTPSSASCHSINTPDLCIQKFPGASLDKIKLASVSSSASSTTSRRGFIKKRSQSTHMPVNKQSWSYNKLLDCWTLLSQCELASDNSASTTAQNANNFIASTLRITKRKSANTQASNRIAQYMNSLADSQDIQKLRLTKIELKYLTQVELKYLKQICFNKLKFELDRLKQQQAPGRKQSLGNYSECLSSIPKDESLKCTKTKNIALRSKSVDFKFFDELKENYFSKKAGVQSATQVFGQSLYKCILNDLQRLPGNKTEAINSNSASSGKRSWRSSNQNVLIASKFDLNIQRKNQQLPPKCDAEMMLNKRNSVLFEALDLKNMKNYQKQLEAGQLTPVLSGATGHKSRGSRSRHTANKDRSKSPASSGEPAGDSALNQNLSIRPEGLVPNIVKSCCTHISEHGLDLVGIFRIDSSKKRIKEIKEMYDSGKPVAMDEHFNPNDSACILKEYLRSLPEPLLTRDLYASFLAASKIKDEAKKLEMISLLVCLLPVPNRDTLQVLLKLLDKVRANASNSDSTGNKMDAFNLAMVFGPNLLKKHCGSGMISVRGISSGKLNDMSDKYNLIDDIDGVISVTKYLIEHQTELFHIESHLHNELIETINKINPAEVNSILSRKQMTDMGISHLPSNGTSSTASTAISTSCSSNSTSSSEALTNQHEYLSLTPTPSEPQSLISSPHSIHLSTNTSCSSASSHSRTAASSSSLSTPEPNTNSSNANFLNYLNADFIDAGHKPFTRQKASRTKLHKIVDNFNYLNCADNNNANLVQQQPIHFINSPTHSPITKGQKKSSVRMLKKQSLESSLKQQQQQQSPVPSSLLLMIQQNNDLINNENKNNSHRYASSTGTKKISTKSMSNLTQIPASNYCQSPHRNEPSSYQVESLRRQSGSNLKHSQFTGSVNSNTIHKLYSNSDKKKSYNIIGEQETLV